MNGSSNRTALTALDIYVPLARPLGALFRMKQRKILVITFLSLLLSVQKHRASKNQELFQPVVT